jgi:hypothetical protein
MVSKWELGRTVCAACKIGKLVKKPIWDGEAVAFVCAECGHVNRWLRDGRADVVKGEGDESEDEGKGMRLVQYPPRPDPSSGG